MLIEHKNESVTLGKDRHYLCLEVSWELEALAELLPLLTTNDTPECLRAGYKVRVLANRIKTLSSVLMAALDDGVEKTEDIAAELRGTP